jgi:hypothetical protein
MIPTHFDLAENIDNWLPTAFNLSGRSGSSLRPLPEKKPV